MARSGTTLIELMVVLAIIVILACLLLPTVRMVRDGAYSAKCQSNLRAIGMGMQAYALDNNGMLPPLCKSNYDNPSNPWGTDAAWCNEKFIGGYLHEIPVPGVSVSVRSVLVCPSDQRWQQDAWSVSTLHAYTPYGASYPLMPLVSSDADWNYCTPLVAISRPAITVFALDANGGMFHPGFASPPECYGIGDSDPINYGFGNPNSAYNWAKRHRGGCNVVYIDGHVAYRPDLRQDSQTGLDSEVKFYR